MPPKAKKVSKFSQLVAEAKKDYKPFEPYEFDAFDPPILITAPDGLERSLALATLMDVKGNVTPDDLKPLLLALVGEEAFPYVWEALRNEPVEVTFALVADINEHFNGQALDGAETLPGGSQGS